MRVSRNSGIIGGLIAGVALGSALGLILAPKPGRVTRRAVRGKTNSYISQLRSRFGPDRELQRVGPEVNHHRS